MTADELRMEIFELLYHKFVEEPETPPFYVGLQGDVIAVLVPGGDHLAVKVVAAHV